MCLPFNSRETETQRGGVTGPKSRRGGNSGTPGFRFPGRGARLCPHPRPFCTPVLPSALGLGQPSRGLFGRTPRPPGERGACSCLRSPPAHLPLSGQPADPASGASRERRPASPAPTAGLRAKQQTGTALPQARRKWLRASRPTVRMRLNAVFPAAGASCGVAVGPEPLEGAGLGAP